MEIAHILPVLLGLAVLAPFVSFWIILLAGPRLGQKGEYASYVATTAILISFVLSMTSFGLWVSKHWPEGGHGAHASAGDHGGEAHEDDEPSHHATEPSHHATKPAHGGADNDHGTTEPNDKGHKGDHGGEGDKHGEEAGHASSKHAYNGVWYHLGHFGGSNLNIGYYIDSLTICMFCMVTLIASCIHFYAAGYMQDELDGDEFVDHEVTMDDGEHLHRPGRYHRFFQALSLFCFSMLGLVIAGNVAMTFCFWELVGICSYFLIGFYVERKSASTAANKAFIVNRVGDFGMIIGLMAIWAAVGTFSYGDLDVVQKDGTTQKELGLFSLVRDEDNHHELVVPAGMVQLGAKGEVEEVVRGLYQPGQPAPTKDEIADAINDPHLVEQWRTSETEFDASTGGFILRPIKGLLNKVFKPVGYGYWLLVVAGIGIFCGCVGKSAQFPLHTWLPDAMEGPTPVSALVHSATMVAAGVFLVARFFPVFLPEVLLVIALAGTITLFMAATIAITATDIKRVLAYSTISQLGYMMLALGVGGWLAGVMHLFTHAFFKSLLFMCSGSVIHGVHTNEMPQMGGLLKKMPITAITMLVGCLAIAGAGIPFLVGFSGYYSKDMILEQALAMWWTEGGLTPIFGGFFFCAAAGGAALTAFYMFRLWFMTFVGKPRDPERYDHAHESPKVMWVPLAVLSVFAVAVGWELELGFAAIPAVAVFFFTGLALEKRSARGLITSGSHHGDHDHEGERHIGEHHDDDHHGNGHDDHDHGHSPACRPYPMLRVVASVAVFFVVWGAMSATYAVPDSLNDLTLHNLLEQARGVGTAETGGTDAALITMNWPSEHDTHAVGNPYKVPATLIAFGTALSGILMACVFYWWNVLDPKDVRNQFAWIYRFLVNKWWFDELYDWIFVKPAHVIARCISAIDKKYLDGLIDGSAKLTRRISGLWDTIIDRGIVDGSINIVGGWVYSIGLWLRGMQTGRLRHYVMFIAVGTVAVFILASFLWSIAIAGS